MTEFCHIIPTKYLSLLRGSSESHSDLLLAHVAEESKEYRDFYANLPVSPYGVRILDNGVFELNKKGVEFDASKLIDIAQQVRATHLVLPDYPNEPSDKTFKSALRWAEEFRKRDSKIKFVFVPQSTIGDLGDFCKSFTEGTKLYEAEVIDYIALSILGVPNAYDSRQKFQRTMTRLHFLQNLQVLAPEAANSIRGMKTPIHMLGLLDGPREIQMCLDVAYINDYNIASWDSSAAAWAGIHGIEFDGSVTGLKDGKFELEVDFDYSLLKATSPETYVQVDTRPAKRNIKFIDRMCKYDTRPL